MLFQFISNQEFVHHFKLAAYTTAPINYNLTLAAFSENNNNNDNNNKDNNKDAQLVSDTGPDREMRCDDASLEGL